MVFLDILSSSSPKRTRDVKSPADYRLQTLGNSSNTHIPEEAAFFSLIDCSRSSMPPLLLPACPSQTRPAAVCPGGGDAASQAHTSIPSLPQKHRIPIGQGLTAHLIMGVEPSEPCRKLWRALLFRTHSHSACRWQFPEFSLARGLDLIINPPRSFSSHRDAHLLGVSSPLPCFGWPASGLLAPAPSSGLLYSFFSGARLPAAI